MRSPLPFTEIASLRVSQSQGKWTENLKIHTLAEHYVRTCPDNVFRNRMRKSIKKVYEDSSLPFHRLERQIKIIVKKKKEGDGGKIILPMPLDTINSKASNIVRSPTWQSPAPIDHPCSSQIVSHLLWFFKMNNIIVIHYQLLWEIYLKSVSKLYILIS